MKKLFTASLLVLTGIALTGCTLFPKKDTNTTQQLTPQESKMKLSEIFGTGKNQECTYDIEEKDMHTTGKIYIAGNKMFHTATIKDENGEMVSSYILNDDWIYAWGDEVPAMKMQLSKMQEMAPDVPEGKPEEVTEPINYKELGMKEDMDMECKKWTPDNSLFQAPSDIEFIDITETLMDFTKQLQQTTETVDGMRDSMCAACDMTPDENTKKECLASLGCN